jgi:hypothetical protein
VQDMDYLVVFLTCNWDGDRRLGHSARAVRK